MKFAVLALALLSILVASVARPAPVAAHPLGNFTINRYARLDLHREALRLHYVIDMAEIPTYQALPTIDTDGDGHASQAELDLYARAEAPRLARGFSLDIGGAEVRLAPITTAAQLLPGQGGLQVLRLEVVYHADVQGAGEVVVAFRDTNYDDRIGWREIVVRPGPGSLASFDPRLALDQSNALRDYPAESLRSAPDVRAVEFRWTPSTGEFAPAAAPIAIAPRQAGGGFGSLLQGDQSPLVLLLSLMAAFGFGALHALGPGHGKTVVAAYLVGSRGTVRHALALGATVTATHTSTVYLLGFVALAASSFILPEDLYLYLGAASGATVVAMGLALLAGRLRRLRATAQDTHRHGFFGRAHTHAHHHHDGPAAGHTPARVSWRGLLTLGVAGGLLPCPSAVVVMLAAISLGRVLLGMLLIVAFSVGLATVLTAIGVALVLGRRLSARSRLAGALQRPAVARFATVLPVLSAVAITLAGLGITYQALSQPGI